MPARTQRRSEPVPADTMAPTLLLWLLVASLPASEGHGRASGEVRDYQVVRPVRLHSLWKRDAEGGRPKRLSYGLRLGGEDVEMQLERNDELLTKDYTETSYREDGTRVTVTPEDMDRCYYQGRLARQRHSSVSISTCNGLRGYIRTGAQRYLIEPLSADDQGDHALMTFNPGSSAPTVCGVTNTSWSGDFEPPTGRSRSRSGVTILQQQKYLELYLVADFRMYEKQQRDEKAVKTRIFDIVNFVNMAYKPLRIFVALVGMEVWSSGDQISVTPPAGATLEAFRRWRNDQLVKWKKHDNAHLISGIDFEGATVGLAFIGTLCSDLSVGVVQDHNDRAIAIGATLAHEMGHNLGMNHDDSSACACSGDSCIMAAALSWNIPQTFSSCSATSLEKFLVERGSACLLDRPDQDSLQAPPICGNGFVEQGEQCDCGKVQDCTNTCCNATTCRLTEGSQCAEGDCCDDCKLAPRSKECRQKEDECDLAEFCDGQSNVCPEDVFAVNGLPCDSGLGYCYSGSCPQRSAQCNRMYGSGATEAGRFCYDYNTKGAYFAFCKRPEKDLYIPCEAEDVMCGKLFCHGGQTNPNYGRMVTISTCKASFYDDHTKDHGQVDPGTRCGEGKVCSQNACVDLQAAYRNANCSARCSGHAVCNHKNACQCLPGWLPPDCTAADGHLDQLAKTLVGVGVAVALVLLGLLAAVLAFLWKRGKIPTRQTQRKRAPARPRPPTAPPPVQYLPAPQPAIVKPRAAPPPPPPAGNRPKPAMDYAAARQALRPPRV